MQLQTCSIEELMQLRHQLHAKYDHLKHNQISLNLTRGIPSPEQVALSEDLDGILKHNFEALNGVDTRNYGGLDGLAEAKQLFAPMIGASPDQMLIAGNSSLALMFQYMNFAHYIGVNGRDSAWSLQDKPRFLCPSPGYDRHFSICEYLGIDMIPVPINESGPDMHMVTEWVKSDDRIKGIWCVPKYSNPTGICYSSEVVNKLAELPRLAGNDFRIMWDNAYSMHDHDAQIQVDSLLAKAEGFGTQHAVVMFGSLSKITLPGAAVAFMAADKENLHHFKQHLQITTIGPDKINQLRHVRFFKNFAGIQQHMTKHAQILKPKFTLVLNKLSLLAGLGVGEWSTPRGGYYISFNTLPGLAKKVVNLCKNLGVSLTPAGATFPYGVDFDDRNIRVAPSYPSLQDLDTAMDVFTCSVKLASVDCLLSIQQ